MGDCCTVILIHTMSYRALVCREMRFLETFNQVVVGSIPTRPTIQIALAERVCGTQGVAPALSPVLQRPYGETPRSAANRVHSWLGRSAGAPDPDRGLPAFICRTETGSVSGECRAARGRSAPIPAQLSGFRRSNGDFSLRATAFPSPVLMGQARDPGALSTYLRRFVAANRSDGTMPQRRLPACGVVWSVWSSGPHRYSHAMAFRDQITGTGPACRSPKQLRQAPPSPCSDTHPSPPVDTAHSGSCSRPTVYSGTDVAYVRRRVQQRAVRSPAPLCFRDRKTHCAASPHYIYQSTSVIQFWLPWNAGAVRDRALTPTRRMGAAV